MKKNRQLVLETLKKIYLEQGVIYWNVCTVCSEPGDILHRWATGHEVTRVSEEEMKQFTDEHFGEN